MFQSKKYNDNLLQILKQLNNFLFIANDGNIGDGCIAFAEHQLFRELKLNYFQTYNKDVDVVVYGGGGKFIKNYYQSALQNIEMLKTQQFKKVIILPTTFHDFDEAVQMFDSRFIIFCRDMQSYNYCTRINKNAKFILHDDMFICSNINDIKFDSDDVKDLPNEFKNYLKNNTSNIGCFLRTDSERTIHSVRGIPNLDMSQFGHIYPSCSYEMSQKCVSFFMHMLSHYDTIISNRLHIVLTAWKMNKKIIAFDNSYGKTFNVLDYSLKGLM